MNGTKLDEMGAVENGLWLRDLWNTFENSFKCIINLGALCMRLCIIRNFCNKKIVFII